MLERVRDVQLLITDLDMKGSMDGLRLAAAIREQMAADPVTAFLFQSYYMGPPKSSQRYAISNRLRIVTTPAGFLRSRLPYLGKCRRRDSRSRRTLPEVARKSIVYSEKANRAVGKLFLIPDASLRHIDDPPRHHLAHSTGIGGPGALASRPQKPVPSLVKGGREYGNGFGIEGGLGPDRINNAGHPVYDDAIQRAPMGSFVWISAALWQRRAMESARNDHAG